MRKEITFNRVIVLFIVFSLILFQSVFFTSDTGMLEVAASEVNHISENTIWEPSETPYLIDGELIIDENITLTIVAGTVVTFTPGSRLIVDGYLSAGTDNSEETVFTSVYDHEYSGVKLKTTDYWEGIYISETGYFDGIRIKASYAERIFNVKGSLNLNQSRVNNAKYNCVYINKGGTFNGFETLISDVVSTSTIEPTSTPTSTPTITPKITPTSTSTITPTIEPTIIPTSTPTVKPTSFKTNKPTEVCTFTPRPTCKKSAKPSFKPICKPTIKPATKPICKPTIKPVLEPICKPTIKPVLEPICKPTIKRALKPICKSTKKPALKPTCKPTIKPVLEPICKPTIKRALKPICKPTIKPALQHTCKPTLKPTCNKIIKSNSKLINNQKTIGKQSIEHIVLNEENSCKPFENIVLDKKSKLKDEKCVQSKKLSCDAKFSCSVSNSNSKFGVCSKYIIRDYFSKYPKCWPKPTCHLVPIITPKLTPTAEPIITPTIEPTIIPTAEPTNTPTPEPTYTPITIPSSPVDFKDSCIIYNEGELNLTLCNISYCSNTGIYVENDAEFYGGDLKIGNCKTGVFVKGTVSNISAVIENCYYGVYSLSEKLVNFEYCTFNNIGSYAIINEVTSNTLTAAYNYWQSPSGPSIYDSETSTWKGEGLKILGNITYEPFLTEPQ